MKIEVALKSIVSFVHEVVFKIVSVIIMMHYLQCGAVDIITNGDIISIIYAHIRFSNSVIRLVFRKTYCCFLHLIVGALLHAIPSSCWLINSDLY